MTDGTLRVNYLVVVVVVALSVQLVTSRALPTQMSPYVVQTQYGRLRGVLVALPGSLAAAGGRAAQPRAKTVVVEAFFGLQYASLLGGELRFMPPTSSMEKLFVRYRTLIGSHGADELDGEVGRRAGGAQLPPGLSAARSRRQPAAARRADRASRPRQAPAAVPRQTERGVSQPQRLRTLARSATTCQDTGLCSRTSAPRTHAALDYLLSFAHPGYG